MAKEPEFSLLDTIQVNHPTDGFRTNRASLFAGTRGEIEIIIKDKDGNVVDRINEPSSSFKSNEATDRELMLHSLNLIEKD